VTASLQGSQGPSKLYVSNLSQAATLTGMRELFSTCGDVLDVEFAAERGARGAPSAAYITMATSTAADKALNDLHGRLHCDRVLVISRVAGGLAASRNGRAGSAPAPRPKPTEPGVVVTQQYRDRHALTYELSCSGKLLTLRFLFPIDDAHAWQVEARTTPGGAALTASAMTREQAFRALATSYGNADNQLAAELDWEGVATALRAVRAL
jgi:hypothetical protein